LGFFFWQYWSFELSAYSLWRQALYCLNHASNPFLLWLFWRQGLAFCPGWPGPLSSYLCFPPLLGWQVCSTVPSFFSVEMGHFCPRWHETITLQIFGLPSR
jgi:hypothetical protein